MNKYECKRTAQRSLLKEYGFAPVLKSIILLEASSNGHCIDYVLFEVNGFEYCYLKNSTYEGVTKKEKEN